MHLNIISIYKRHVWNCVEVSKIGQETALEGRVHFNSPFFFK